MIINEPIYNLEVEQQVLGLLIKDSTHSNSRETLDSLSVTDFYTRSHQGIFKTIKLMTENKKDVSLALVEDAMENIGFDYGGFIYLAELMKAAISISNMSSYVNVVKKCARLRDLSSVLLNTNELINQKVEATEIIEQLDNEIKNISINSSGKDLRHIRDVEGAFLDELDARAARGGSIAGLSTGIDELDERINGVGDECLVVVAGSPSMGKTLFCQTIATSVGVDQQKNAMFFSMEMSEHSLFERFISGIGNISPDKLKSARLNNEELGRTTGAVRALRSSGLYITDEPKQSVGQIRAKVRRHKIKHPDLSAIFIDYLGLMKLGKADRHDIAIGNITRDLKELAKEMKVPIFLCVQSKRPFTVQSRPNMSSLKDSSCIEADADLIMFVHRQEIVEPETSLKGVTELIIAKDRHNDGNGTVYLEKCNGSFKALSTEAVARLQHEEELRLNPKKESRKKGFDS
jgi:replicative DNA helicase